MDFVFWRQVTMPPIMRSIFWLRDEEPDGLNMLQMFSSFFCNLVLSSAFQRSTPWKEVEGQCDQALALSSNMIVMFTDQKRASR
jgi:hypothetical protein